MILSCIMSLYLLYIYVGLFVLYIVGRMVQNCQWFSFLGLVFFFAPPKHKLHSCYGIAYVSSSWMVVGCGIKQIFDLHRMGGSMFGPIIRGSRSFKIHRNQHI